MSDLIAAAAADPRAAYDAASAMTVADDALDRVTARRALGLACKELGRLAEGLAHLDEALRIATAERLPYAAAQVKMTLVGLLVARGDIAGALAAADEAAPVLTGTDAERLLANRVCALARSGRLAEVTRLGRRCTDPEVLVGLRVNVGLARAYAGRLGRGEADLRGALAVAERAGLRHQAAMVRHKLALVALRRGDLPRALAIYDDVEPELAGVGERLCQLWLDRAEALVAAHLPDEARALLARTLDRLDGAGYRCDTADALLLLSYAELADGDPHAAAATAVRARDAFGPDRARFALLAEQVELHARWAAGERSAALAAEAERAADRLERAGWSPACLRVVAGLAALAQGRREHARLLLSRVEGSRIRGGRVGDGRIAHSGTVSARVAAWHAAALLRLADGDRGAASAAIRAGLRVVEEHAAALGAAELRGRAAGWSAELASLGVRLARGPRTLLVAAERARAIADLPPAVRPPRDRRLAGLLAELRRVSAEAAERPELLAAQTRLEDAVRARTRRLAAGRNSVRGWGWLVPGLCAELGDRVFAELIRADDELLAVTVVDGRCRRVALGSYAEAEHDLRLLRFAVSRLAREPSGPAGAAGPVGAAAQGLAGAAGRLDAALLRPLRLGDRPVVLAPSGALHGLPWAALPSLQGRPLTVVPSAASWLRAMRSPADYGQVVPNSGQVVPGPGHVVPGLGHVVPCPGHVIPASGHVIPASGHVVPASGQVVSASGHVMPDSVDVIPHFVDTMPGVGRGLVGTDSAALHASAASGHVALVAGPGLEHAESEIEALRACHPRARVLTGADATAEAVRSALDGAAIAHLAVHGRFRAGNALFSSLRLVDGPLVTYDLEHLRRPPRLLILSACDAGRADVRAGEAVMGMARCALGFGTGTVVAGVTPVGDAATRDLMAGFHERLTAGLSPAEALAATPRDPATLGFVCFGAGY